MPMKRFAFVILAALAASGAAAAQVGNQQQIIQGGGPGPGGPGFPGGPGGPGRQGSPGGPPRDAGPRITGTGVIKGRVLAADTGRPLRRARINVVPGDLVPGLGPGGPGPGGPITTSTGVDGRYEIKELPAGRYTVMVNRSGYLQLRYGQRRPFEQGKPIQVADRQTVDNIDFALPRMSVLGGRVFDETGDPISGVQMFAMRSVFFEGKRRMVPVSGGPGTQTDDTGQYRLLGLPPGTYFVSANIRDTWTTTENGQDVTLGYAPTYFPGTTNLNDARRVTVGLGQEASNNDFSLIPGRTANVSGIATDSQGRPFASRQVQLTQQWRGPGFGMFIGAPGSQTGPDGSFRIRNLAPGDYSLRVSGTTEINGASVQESASASLTVSGVDIDNLSLAASSGWTVTGRVTDEAGGAPTVPSARVRVMPRPLDGSQGFAPPGGGGPGPDNGRVKDDWSFSAVGQGPARLRAAVPDGVMVKAILQDGRDISDQVIDLRSGETLDRVQIVLSTTINSVTGQLTDDKGAPLADGTILVFSND